MSIFAFLLLSTEVLCCSSTRVYKGHLLFGNPRNWDLKNKNKKTFWTLQSGVWCKETVVCVDMLNETVCVCVLHVLDRSCQT